MKTFSRARLGVACVAAAFWSFPATADYVFNSIETAPGLNSGFWGVSAKTQKFMLQTFGGDELHSSYIYDPTKSPPNDLVLLPPPPDRAPPALPWLSVTGISINDQGTIVGAVADAEHEYGFIYAGGQYSIYSRPGWDNIEFRGINNPHPVTGAVLVSGLALSNTFDGVNPATVAFVFDGTNYVDFTVPGAPLFATVIAHGINDAGQVVGSAAPYQIGPAFPGIVRTNSFLREPDGTMTLFNVPNGWTFGGMPAVHTRARGINNKGEIAGVTLDANGHGQVFVGTSAGFQVLALPNGQLPLATLGGFTEGINDSGQIAGSWIDANNVSHAMIITPASLPTATTPDGAYTFNVQVIPNTPIFIDPKLAVGYDYSIGTGDPRVATVRFPIGIGDNKYRLIVGKKVYDLNGGTTFDFRANGFPAGIDKFRVTCIDTAAVLDPLNSVAFPTELTFMSAGSFTGTQKPLTFNVSEHALPALMSVNICPRQSRHQ